jgi:hypothetical protein
MTTTTLDARIHNLLAPFSVRPATTSTAEASRRRDGFRFGWELNRLQGGRRSPAGGQLEELYAQGRISEQEYFDLVAVLAASGGLNGDAGRTYGG